MEIKNVHDLNLEESKRNQNQVQNWKKPNYNCHMKKKKLKDIINKKWQN